MHQEVHEILQNSSNEEYTVHEKEENDNEENNYT
jgi:hypothetical protein